MNIIEIMFIVLFLVFTIFVFKYILLLKKVDELKIKGSSLLNNLSQYENKYISTMYKKMIHDQQPKFYVSLYSEESGYKEIMHFPVNGSVYIYIRQLETAIKTEKFESIREKYPHINYIGKENDEHIK